MILEHKLIEIRTHGYGFENFTQELQAFVRHSGLTSGVCSVFVRHTSASLVIQENADPAVLRDLARWFSELAPESRPWEHADEGPDDMPAHARSALTRTSEVIPVQDGELLLGTWQGIYLWEHRSRGHRRQVVATVQGG